MTFELLGYSTENYHDVRWRSYTNSAKVAAKFREIPRIDFSDSGHGIVFTAREHNGPKDRIVKIVADHVLKHGGIR